MFNKIEQKFIPKPINFNRKDTKLIQTEVGKMLKKGILEQIDNRPEHGEFISNIFIRPKKMEEYELSLI